MVDNREAVRRALEGTDAEIKRSVPDGGLDFLDPWGNYWQVVEYADVQFTKAPEVLEGMGLSGLEKIRGSRATVAGQRHGARVVARIVGVALARGLFNLPGQGLFVRVFEVLDTETGVRTGRTPPPCPLSAAASSSRALASAIP